MFKVFFNPYPHDGTLKFHLRFNIFIGLFVATFLIFFEPFGISKWQDPNKIAKLIGYGFVAFMIPTLLFFIKKLFINEEEFEKEYKVYHEIAWFTVVMLFIVFGNIIYSKWIGAVDISMAAFFKVSFFVLLIGLFPITISIILKHNNYKKLNSKEAKVINEAFKNYIEDKKEENIYPNNTITKITTLKAENDEMLSCEADNIFFLESKGNYVRIAYLQNHNLIKKTLRVTLKSVEEQLIATNIVKCHRSYLVNLDLVNQIQGNAQGYQISFTQIADIVPVSRSFGAKILKLLKNQS